ncbi:hypothetical protein BS17DRAFT_809051 [Gyrodon lividus]|nr:hypothetical protein BS17DRAFT_809051 [Gyrodon lividus]
MALQKLYNLFDLILTDPRGGPLFHRWLEAQAIDIVSRKIYDEMDEVKDTLRGTIGSITPEFLATWDVNSTMSSIMDETAPTLDQVLESASQTDRARRENTKKTPTTCLDRATAVAQGPHILCYDNIDISTSIFVEQRSSAPAKVQSGTFPVLYTVRNGNPEHMRLAPMLQRAQQASDLTFDADIRPNLNQVTASQSQLKIHVIDILLQYNAHFKDYEYRLDPMLQHEERRRLPKGHKTKQYPLRTSTIDESSITGNIAVIHDVYINQLKMSHQALSDTAIPSINDQATNARIRKQSVFPLPVPAVIKVSRSLRIAREASS